MVLILLTFHYFAIIEIFRLNLSLLIDIKDFQNTWKLYSLNVTDKIISCFATIDIDPPKSKFPLDI